MSAADLTDEELIAELIRRGKELRCRCQRWQTYLGVYDPRGYTWRCYGCDKAIDECRCP